MRRFVQLPFEGALAFRKRSTVSVSVVFFLVTKRGVDFGSVKRPLRLPELEHPRESLRSSSRGLHPRRREQGLLP